MRLRTAGSPDGDLRAIHTRTRMSTRLSSYTPLPLPASHITLNFKLHVGCAWRCMLHAMLNVTLHCTSSRSSASCDITTACACQQAHKRCTVQVLRTVPRGQVPGPGSAETPLPPQQATTVRARRAATVGAKVRQVLCCHGRRRFLFLCKSGSAAQARCRNLQQAARAAWHDALHAQRCAMPFLHVAALPSA